MTELILTTPLSDVGKRADQALGSHLPSYSRSQIQAWIKEGHLFINQMPCRKPNKILKHQDKIQLNIPPPISLHHAPEALELDIVFEDSHIMVINKPAGLTVHPGAGNPNGTLLNGLLMHDKNLQDLPRAGIVHRLDKDTSGLMVIAKTALALNALTEMIKNRDVTRIYLALAWGNTPSHFSAMAPIGRHQTKRTHMAVISSGKPATTHFELIESLNHFSLLRCKLDTGRTHQIRVHLLHHGFPIAGDPTYHKKIRLNSQINPKVQTAVSELTRQFLHAHILAFNHPVTEAPLKFECPLPLCLSEILQTIRQNSQPCY